MESPRWVFSGRQAATASRPSRTGPRAHMLSLLMISPRLRVPIERQVEMSMVFLMNRTEPSPSRTFTPPECSLLAVVEIRNGGNMQERLDGGPTW